MTSIVDFAQDGTSQIIHLQADNITTVMRYLTWTGSSKMIKAAEARAYAAAGIRVGLVYEAGGGAPGQPTLCAVDGSRDANFSRSYAPTIGAPPGACIYFAADNDFGADQVRNQVVPYFTTIAAVMDDSGFDVGAYGSGLVLQTLYSAGLIKKGWLSGSLGWSNSRALLAAKPAWLVLVQDEEDTRLANMDVDTDYALGDIGDFEPFAMEATS
jgi:Domain of unknown function (DUF1906)